MTLLGGTALEAMSLDVEEGLATITLRRPESLNALNLKLKAELAGAIAELASDTAVRAVLVAGEGRAFSAGGAIDEMEAGRSATDQRGRMLRVLGDIIIPLSRLEKPVVAAVNGHAHGAGLSLALACDIALAAESAVFSFAFARLGLVPDSGALYFLARRMPPHLAKDLLFTARRFGAEEARELGLVNHVLPDDELLPAATALARELAAGPTVAFGLTKRMLAQAADLPFEDVAELEALGQAVAVGTEDFAEGRRAFLEKRAARFAGR